LCGVGDGEAIVCFMEPLIEPLIDELFIECFIGCFIMLLGAGLGVAARTLPVVARVRRRAKNDFSMDPMLTARLARRA
jgi:hypothetical protein